MADEYHHSLVLLGLKLVDLHKILYEVLHNAYFTYNGRLYQQLVGLFMGCKVSPLLAIVKVYTFEKRILHVDQNYISLPYGRYVDDAYTLASTRHDAETMFRDVAALDPDGMLQWEVDFPDTDSSSGFVPFLGTQIKVENDGVAFKFYRKPQKKNIVLHFKSHHTLKTKSEVAKNFYRTAEQSSSSPSLAEESFKVIDNLLRCNGYSNPREFLKRCFGVSSGYDRNKQSGTVCLKLPHLSEYTSNQILKFIKKHNIPISVTFTPGKKLRDIFCSSRPYDKPQCMRNNCAVCINLEDGCCATKTPVYLITCILCNQQYVGESGRSVHDRLSEHLRYAKNPTNKSYSEEAFAQHYREHHPNLPPKLRFKIIETEPNVVRRKILEEYYISLIEPKLNNKDKYLDLKRFLI